VKNVGEIKGMGKAELFSEVFSKYDHVEVDIDRKEENESIKRFQETGDMSILEEVYIRRIPTLKIWALRFYYPGLEISIDDFVEELSIVFVKAANKYNIKKGSFNTCLYTYLNNRIKNMKNATHAKKRRPEDYSGPISGILLSLDYTYSNEKGGNETTLIDILKNKEELTENHVSDKGSFQETVDMLSDGDDVLKSVFIKLGEGNTLSSIIRELKTFSGEIKVTKKELMELEDNDYTSLKEVIVKKSKIEDSDFVVLDWELVGNNLINYSIEFKDTEETKKIQRTIKDLRKNKDEYIKKIKEN